MAVSRIAGVEYAAAPRAQQYAAALAWPPRLVVIHDTGNPTSNRRGEAKYAATRTDDRSRWTSAHAYIDQDGVLGSLPLDRQAWAAYSYANRYGWHLELCLPGDRTKTRRNAAAVVRWLCQQAGIPMVKLSPADVAAGKRGVCGHRDITLGLKVGDHTDPGADFPWTQFMDWVRDGASLAGDEDDMANTWTEPLTQGTDGFAGQQRDTALAFAWKSAYEANEKADQILQRLGQLGGGAPTQDQVNAAVAGLVDQIADRVADKLAARLQS